jgi:uncharacterized protein
VTFHHARRALAAFALACAAPLLIAADGGAVPALSPVEAKALLAPLGPKVAALADLPDAGKQLNELAKREHMADGSITEKARPILEASCGLGWAGGCHNLANQLKDGIGGAANMPRALALYQSACDRGVYISCYDAGRILLAKKHGMVDEPRGMGLLTIACYADIGQACGMQARQMMFSPSQPLDLERIEALWGKACKFDPKDGCRAQQNYLNGKPHLGELAAEKPDVVRLLWTDGGGAQLLAIGYAREQAGDKVAAGGLYRASCFARSGAGCDNSGIYAFGGRPGTPKDVDLAHRYFQTACELDFAKGCQNYGASFFRAVSADRAPAEVNRAALAAYDKACTMGLGESCNRAGIILLEGWSGTKDLAQSQAYMTAACQKGYRDACPKPVVVAAPAPPPSSAPSYSPPRNIAACNNEMTNVELAINGASLVVKDWNIRAQRDADRGAPASIIAMSKGTWRNRLGQYIVTMERAQTAMRSLGCPSSQLDEVGQALEALRSF